MKLKIDEHTITTTVGELIEALKKIDKDTLVYTEGCDCTGNVVDISLEEDGSLLICRDDDVFDYDWDAPIGKRKHIKEKYKNRI